MRSARKGSEITGWDSKIMTSFFPQNLNFTHSTVLNFRFMPHHEQYKRPRTIFKNVFCNWLTTEHFLFSPSSQSMIHFTVPWRKSPWYDRSFNHLLTMLPSSNNFPLMPQNWLGYKHFPGRVILDICISYFSHCCGQYDKNNLQEEGSLTQSLVREHWYHGNGSKRQLVMWHWL